MNEIFPNTPTAAVQLFIIVRESDQENSIIKPLCEFKLQSMAKDIVTAQQQPQPQQQNNHNCSWVETK